MAVMARRRWLAIGGALAAGLTAAYVLRRRARRAANEPGARLSPGSVDKEQFLADERYVQEGLREADLDGRRARVFDRGAGHAIVFVPITSGLAVVYSRQLRAFAHTNRVLLYERDEKLEQPVSVEARVQELRKLLDHRGIERAHVVGLADAGAPTLLFGRLHPDRALSLTAINLGPRYRMPPYWLNERIIMPLTERLPVERVVPDAAIRILVGRISSAGGGLSRQLTRHMVGQIRQPMRVHKFSMLPISRDHDTRTWAHTLAVPTLLIGRDDDPFAPVAELEQLASALPDCRGLHILPDGGRYITYTWADRVNDLLRDFFAATEESPSSQMPAPAA